MRISELARTTGVPVPTVKYYLREGLLPRGARGPSPNQADYGEEHVRRLGFIRALREVGGMPIAGVGAIVRAIDDPALSLHQVLGIVNQVEAGHTRADHADEEAAARARADVHRFLDELGWEVSEEAPARGSLAEALLAIRLQGREVDPSIFRGYAAAADALAASEVASVPTDAPRDEAVAYAVVGTIVTGSALLALRRLAQEHHSARLLGGSRVPSSDSRRQPG